MTPSQEAEKIFWPQSYLADSGGHIMRRRFILTIVIVITLGAVWAQIHPERWRGAGPTPCVGSDGGILQCPPAVGVIAIRAGRLFDSKTGQMLTR